mgnify:CR=1 FL=1
MTATITKTTSRFGQTIWAVRWGPGATQMAICLTEAEAAKVAETRLPATKVEPLVSFRDY